MKISEVLRELTEALRESHQRFDDEVAALNEMADSITQDCDQLIAELD